MGSRLRGKDRRGLRVTGCGFRVGSSTAHRAGLVQGDRVTQRFTEIFRDAQRVGSRLRGNDKLDLAAFEGVEGRGIV